MQEQNSQKQKKSVFRNFSNYSIKLRQFLQESIEKELLSRCIEDQRKTVSGVSKFCIRMPLSMSLTQSQKHIFVYKDSLFPCFFKSTMGQRQNFKSLHKLKTYLSKKTRQESPTNALKKANNKNQYVIENQGNRMLYKNKVLLNEHSVNKLKVQGIKSPILSESTKQRQKSNTTKEITFTGSQASDIQCTQSPLLKVLLKKKVKLGRSKKSMMGVYLNQNQYELQKDQSEPAPTVTSIKKLELQQMRVTKQEVDSQPISTQPKPKLLNKIRIDKKQKSQIIRPAALKLPDDRTNSRIYFDFIKAIAFSNYVAFECKTVPTVFISRKNNGELVKSLLRSRQWLSIRNEFNSQISFVWSNIAKPCRTKLEAKKEVSLDEIEQIKMMGRKNNLLNRVINTGQNNICYQKQAPFFSNYSHRSLLDSSDLKFQNMLPDSDAISTKKGLFYSIKAYCAKLGKQLEDIIPRTIHVETMGEHEEWQTDLEGELWIVKPGEGTNRGKGIFISRNSSEIASYIKSKPQHTYIIQKYIQNPLLYHKRKFDIRVYMLVTTIQGCVKAYFYEEGYARTSSYQFSLDSLQQKIHLTNDAMQHLFQSYGKFQAANKLSLNDLELYLKEKGIRFADVWGRIKEVCREVMLSCYDRLGAEKQMVSFELFGLDFMIDDQAKVYLIEVNSNPCLETRGSILSVIIPRLLQNTFRVGLDPILPPPRKRVIGSCDRWWQKDTYQENRFVLIFDSLRLA